MKNEERTRLISSYFSMKRTRVGSKIGKFTMVLKSASSKAHGWRDSMKNCDLIRSLREDRCIKGAFDQVSATRMLGTRRGRVVTFGNPLFHKLKRA